MKRIITLICAVSLILGCIPSGIVFAASSPSILVNEVFEDVATNALPESIIAKTGIDKRVVDITDFNKALYAKAKSEPVKISVPLSECFDKTVMSFDIMMQGAPVTGNALKLGTSGKAMLAFSDDRFVSLEDGMDVSGYPDGVWMSYAMAIDFKNNTYDLYVNDKLKVENRRITFVISKPASIEFEFACTKEGEEAEVYMDNIRVYEGKTILKSFPKKQYNSEKIEFTPGQADEKVYDTIYIDSVSKQGLSGVAFVQKADTTAGWDTMDGDDTPYIHFTKTASNDTYADITPGIEEAPVKYVWQMDLYSKGHKAGFFVRMRGDDGTSDIITVDASSNIVVNSKTVGKLPLEKWTTVAAACDVYAGTQDVYINGELAAKGVLSPNGGIAANKVRIGFTSGGAGKNDIWVNKIKFYEGTELRKFEDKVEIDLENADAILVQTMTDTILEKEKDAQEILGSDVLFMTSNGKFFANGKKQSYSVYGKDAFLDGDKLMVDVNVLEYALGIKPDPSKQKYVSKDGAQFVDATAFAKSNGKSVYTDNRKFIIISNSPKGYKNNEISGSNAVNLSENSDLVWRYMQFDRPRGDELYNAIVEKHHKSHPRLFVTKDEVADLKARVHKDPSLKKALLNLLDTCDSTLTEPLTERTLDAAGIRIFSSCAAVGERLFELGTAYLFTGDKKYGDRAWAELENALNWEDWNLSVHFLDSGEIGPGVAFAYDVFYDYFTDTQKEFIRDKLQVQYLDYCVGVFTGASPYKVTTDNYRGFGSNWNSVTTSAMLANALVLMDEEDPDSYLTQKCKYIAENAIQLLEGNLTGLAPEGTWNEGIGYYEYVLQHLGWAIEMNLNIFGDDFGYLSTPGFKELPQYAMYMETVNGSYNKGATTGTPKHFPPEVYLYAKAYNDPEMMGLYDVFRKMVNINSFIPQYLLFCEPDFMKKPDNINLPLDKYFDSNDTGVVRGSWTDADSIYLGTAGGQGGHYDKGSFIFEILGERWSVDIGRNGSSTMYFVDRADVHSALVINPDAEQKGQNSAGKATALVESKERGTKMVYELSGVYDEWVTKYRRAFLTADDRNTLVVRDELKLKAPSDLDWIMMTKANIEIAADGKSAVLSQNGKKLKVEAICSESDWKFIQTEDAAPTGGWVDGEQSHKAGNIAFSAEEQKAFTQGVKKLILRTKGDGDVNFTVKLSPVVESYVFEEIKDISIDELTIPDGKMPPKPEASAIYADGTLIDGFTPGIKEYTLTYAYGSSVPVFSAESSVGNVEIIQPTTFADSAKIIVTLDNGRKATYTIKFNVKERILDALLDILPSVGLPEGANLAKPEHSWADYEPQPANNAANVIDGDFTTGWASDKVNTYVEVDLGKVEDLSGIAIAFRSGKSRNYLYDILISEDKMDYKKIFSGRSSGQTNEYEFLNAPCKARYVRLVGHLHTNGNWNNVTELRPVLSK